MLVVNELHKIYRLGRMELRALAGVSLTADRGEMIALMGPSGSGKTTLLNLLGCLDAPTNGTILFQGNTLNGALTKDQLADFRRDHLGFIFQFFNLIPVLTAFENIEYPLILRKIPAGKRRKKVVTILERLGIASFAHHRPHELSGGQQQRVAVGRALVIAPSLVLADEPTGNLDSQTAEDLLILLRRINQEERTTFIIATHNVQVAHYCHRVIHLEDGKVVHVENHT